MAAATQFNLDNFMARDQRALRPGQRPRTRPQANSNENAQLTDLANEQHGNLEQNIDTETNTHRR